MEKLNLLPNSLNLFLMASLEITFENFYVDIGT